MTEWNQQIQTIIDEIDKCIVNSNDEALTLKKLSQKLGYSEFYVTRKFKEISGIHFRTYLRERKLAFALKEIRDTDKSLLDIALNFGFSSHEAFTRAFKINIALHRVNIAKVQDLYYYEQKSLYSIATFWD